MFEKLEDINSRPQPFQFYTADELWTDEHTSKQMLKYHLNESIDVSSRKAEFIDRSVDWIVTNFKIDSSTNIADFGCGPGLYTSRFAEKGAKVTGIDFSTNSINYARTQAQNRGLKIDYVHQNYLLYETDQSFDLIVMIMCDFCALSPQQRKQLLQKFSKYLKPIGSILLDVYTLESFKQRTEQSKYEINLLDGFWSSKKYYGFQNTLKYEREKVVLDKYTIIEKDRERVIYNWLQYFGKESLASELEENNFKVDKFLSDVACAEFDPGNEEMAVIAKKAT